MTSARRILALLVVVVATLAGGYGALVAYRADAQLSVGGVRFSMSPGHTGALDLYVPLVDWGARFEAIRAPVRLRVDLRTVDRGVVARVAQGRPIDVNGVRAEARDAIAAYLRALLGVVFAGAVALGALVALAIRSRTGPRLRFTLATALLTAVGVVVALAVLLPPRGRIDEPQYYAYGSDVPRALRAVEVATRASRTLDQELNTQLVGLAQLVIAPGERTGLPPSLPRVIVASDLHNNVLALPVLERTARGAPVLFPGDATDRGTPLESRLTRRLARAGRPFVFVTGNHDSDVVTGRLVADGAIVLTDAGRLRADGTHGPLVVRVGGLRVAGYADPFERRSAEDFRDRYDRAPAPGQQAAFAAWLRPLIGRVDVVMVHEPNLLAAALAELREQPPPDPLLFAVGHTHRPDVLRAPNVTVLDGGSIGGGGTGNLGEGTPISLGVLLYTVATRFTPLAADLVSIDPGSGSSTARRVRLDGPVPIP